MLTTPVVRQPTSKTQALNCNSERIACPDLSGLQGASKERVDDKKAVVGTGYTKCGKDPRDTGDLERLSSGNKEPG